mmetsp:Transcript_57372/g.92968  ORF Transcript_57372/g.92968 Transcript_57372/m.92968 type:complete len:173 (+) Transcript_57372:90-608(+)
MLARGRAALRPLAAGLRADQGLRLAAPILRGLEHHSARSSASSFCLLPSLAKLPFLRSLTTITSPAAPLPRRTTTIGAAKPYSPVSAPASSVFEVSSVSPLMAAAGSRRLISTKQRNRFKMDKHQYLKNVKKVRYVSAIPQYTGPLGRQTKKRCIMKDFRKMPRLRVFVRER